MEVARLLEADYTDSIISRRAADRIGSTTDEMFMQELDTACCSRSRRGPLFEPLHSAIYG